MRILHVISTLNPEAGGPTEAVLALLKFCPPGHENEVATLDDPEAWFLTNMEVPVHGLGPQTSNYGFVPKMVPWLKKNRDRFDGVVVHGLWQYCGFAVWRVFRGHKPYMVFPHGMLDPYFRHAFPLKHLKKWVYWVPAEYWVLRHAFRVLFTGQAEKELANKSFWLHRWTATVVPFGATAPTEGFEAMAEVFLAKWPQLQGKRYLLFLGRIHRKKGCDLLIKSFIKYAERDPELILVMAGPDQQGWQGALEKQIAAAGLSDRVIWTGMVLGDEKWGAFVASEAFILPSHQENFGIAVAEALACGVPALLADKVNIAPEIEEDGAGYMELDTQTGTDRLFERWFETSPTQRAKMSAQARITFKTRYDMRENAEAVMGLFEMAYKDKTQEATWKAG